jgi:hypothetical protein
VLLSSLCFLPRLAVYLLYVLPLYFLLRKREGQRESQKKTEKENILIFLIFKERREREREEEERDASLPLYKGL